MMTGSEKTGRMNGAEGIRINKYLSESGVCSRREADRLIAAGRVFIDGETACAGMKVKPGQVVAVDGREVSPDDHLILLALNKPDGVVCTTDRTWGDVLVGDLVSDYPHRVFSIGRLDKRSEGLLLLTNKGDLVNRLLRAEHGHEKEYLVTVDREVTNSFLDRLASGIWLPESGVWTLPARTYRRGRYQFGIILTQGLNRQIRRMCEVCGYEVRKLQRIRIMNILLGDLPAGKWRELSEAEKTELLSLCRYSQDGEAGSSGLGNRDEQKRI